MMHCRTDVSTALKTMAWFRFPYPFQWGMPTFQWKTISVMMVASVIASIDSVRAHFDIYLYTYIWIELEDIPNFFFRFPKELGQALKMCYLSIYMVISSFSAHLYLLFEKTQGQPRAFWEIKKTLGYWGINKHPGVFQSISIYGKNFEIPLNQLNNSRKIGEIKKRLKDIWEGAFFPVCFIESYSFPFKKRKLLYKLLIIRLGHTMLHLYSWKQEPRPLELLGERLAWRA